MKTIKKQLEKNILKFVNFPKEDNKILIDMLNNIVKIKINELIELLDLEIKSHEEHYPKLSHYARAKHKHTIIILKKLKLELRGWK